MPEETMQPKKICSRIGFAAFAMFVAFQAGSYATVFVIKMIDSSFLHFHPTIMLLASSLPLYLFGVPLFLLILRKVPNYNAPVRIHEKVSFGKCFKTFIFCLGASYALALVSSVVVAGIMFLKDALGLPMNLLNTDIFTNVGLIPRLLIIAVMPAFGEEFICRYMLRKKLQGAGDKMYILMSALVFSFMHANISQMPFAFVVGAIFAFAYLQTNKIWVPILLHFMFNAVGVFLQEFLADVLATTQIETLEFSPKLLLVFVYILAVEITTAVLLATNIKKASQWHFMPPAHQGWPHKVNYARLALQNQMMWQAAAVPLPRYVYQQGYHTQVVQNGAPPTLQNQQGYAPQAAPHINNVPQQHFQQPQTWQLQQNVPMGAHIYGKKQQGLLGFAMKNFGMIAYMCVTSLIAIMQIILM